MRCLMLFLFLLTPFFNYAQNTLGKGKIFGQVLDQGTKTPVDFATISLYKKGSSSPFNGLSADHQGRFVLENIQAGDYILTIDFLGYQRKSIELSLNAALTASRLSREVRRSAPLPTGST